MFLLIELQEQNEEGRSEYSKEKGKGKEVCFEGREVAKENNNIVISLIVWVSFPSEGYIINNF